MIKFHRKSFQRFLSFFRNPNHFFKKYRKKSPSTLVSFILILQQNLFNIFFNTKTFFSHSFSIFTDNKSIVKDTDWKKLWQRAGQQKNPNNNLKQDNNIDSTDTSMIEDNEVNIDIFFLLFFSARLFFNVIVLSNKSMHSHNWYNDILDIFFF